ncbi:hypothetical protein Tco_0430973, partial [Tanacetum coccineum]
HEKNEEDIDDDDGYWEKKLSDEYERYTEMSDIPLNYTTKKELYLLFCHGFLANDGQLGSFFAPLTGPPCGPLAILSGGDKSSTGTFAYSFSSISASSFNKKFKNSCASYRTFKGEPISAAIRITTKYK